MSLKTCLLTQGAIKSVSARATWQVSSSHAWNSEVGPLGCFPANQVFAYLVCPYNQLEHACNMLYIRLLREHPLNLTKTFRDRPFKFKRDENITHWTNSVQKAGDDPLFTFSESETRITQFMVNPQPEKGLCHPKHTQLNQGFYLFTCSNIGWTSTVAGWPNRACVSGAKRSNMELYSGALVLYACHTKYLLSVSRSSSVCSKLEISSYMSPNFSDWFCISKQNVYLLRVCLFHLSTVLQRWVFRCLKIYQYKHINVDV